MQGCTTKVIDAFISASYANGRFTQPLKVTLDRGVKAVHSLQLYAYTLVYTHRVARPMRTIEGTGPLAMDVNTFTGNNVTTQFTLTGPFIGDAAAGVYVSVNGTRQVPYVDYTVTQNVITFATAPPGSSSVYIQWFERTDNPVHEALILDIQEIDGELISNVNNTRGAFAVLNAATPVRSDFPVIHERDPDGIVMHRFEKPKTDLRSLTCSLRDFEGRDIAMTNEGVGGIQQNNSGRVHLWFKLCVSHG